jgi:hypothetical protein
MYTLDFETMKQVMQEHKKTGFLYADVPSGVTGLSGPCRIEVKLMAGAIDSCSIVSERGQRLPEKESIKQVSRLGTLLWVFAPQTSAVQQISPALTPREASPFPQRTVQTERWQMNSWSRLHRSIFALADGTRSVAKIAEMLSVPPEHVDKSLRDLQSVGAIVMGPYNGRTRT